MRFLVFLSVLSFLIITVFRKFSQLLPGFERLSLVIAFGILVVSIAWLFWARLKAHSIDHFWYKVIMWAGSFSMGLMGTWIFFGIPFDLVLFVFRPTQSIFDQVTQAVFFAALLMTVIGFFQSRNGPVIKNVLVPIDRLPPALKNFKVAQISDLHVGLTIDQKYVADVVHKVMALQADIIVITGDLADGTPESLKDRLVPLTLLKAKHGVYFITGNHEYYSGAKAWIQFAIDCGFIPLLNQNRVINVDGAQVLIAGVTDFSGGRFFSDHAPDFKKARGDQSADFKILLAHQPQAYKYASRLDFDLQLSGHTHAGQFFPFSLLVGLVHKYNRGLGREGSLWVYVNQGTGYWGPAHRFLVPSEISLLKLI
jgi:predicted MPP superfamily phosphohydrolase